ncbi:MAG: YfhO family protein, partial [Bacteroidetes bacterium]|nr:YfhO family protein [Bacteroidota bacterium]
EMYYPAGWRAFIDGEETEIYKTNHALRSIVVSEGSHKIEFRFQPRTYFASLWIMGSSTILVYLILGISLIYEFRYKRIGKKEGKADKNIRN